METGFVAAGVGLSIGLVIGLGLVWWITRDIFKGEEDDDVDACEADTSAALDGARVRHH